jgi:hypothetical protein
VKTSRILLPVLLLYGVALCAQPKGIPLINNPLIPDAIAPGSAGFTLKLSGTGFAPGSVVAWNGSARSTTFVSSGRLKAKILASDIATAGTASVTVVNPGLGGGRSNPVYFEVREASTVPPSFAVTLPTIGDPVAETAIAATVGDFNGDGIADLAVADFDGSFAGNFISVLLGAGGGNFPTHVEYRTGRAPISILTADFNHDGKLDLGVSNSNAKSISILLGNGDGTFQNRVNYATGLYPQQLVLGDFNHDGNLDLAVGNNESKSVSVLLGNGDGTFQNRVDYAVGTFPANLSVGDFNGDGKLDLAVLNHGDNTINLLFGQGDGRFAVQPAFGINALADAIATADLNGDGKLDLVVAILTNSTGDNVAVMMGNGNGTFQSPTSYPTPYEPTSITTGDFNGDGKVDLAVSSHNCPPRGNCGIAQVSIFWGNGDGTFQPRFDFGTDVDLAYAAVVGDFNNDGLLDLVVPGGGTDSITVSVLMQTTNASAAALQTDLNLGMHGASAK